MTWNLSNKGTEVSKQHGVISLLSPFGGYGDGGTLLSLTKRDQP